MQYTHEQMKKMLHGAYKKLKSYYFYDKTLLFIKKKIAEFESDDTLFSQTFDKLTEALVSEDKGYFDALIAELDYVVLPKSLAAVSAPPAAIVGTIDHHKTMAKINFFIDAPIELLIVDCLWTLYLAKIGHQKYGTSTCSYAGKFKSSIFYTGQDGLYEGIDFESNRCFEPYFKNYSKWQRDAFTRLRQGLKKRDQLMFSLDLKSFYYSVRFKFNTLHPLLNYDPRLTEIAFITCVEEQIYRAYTRLISPYKIGIDIADNAVIFPIGLLSPILLRELYLYQFDQNIRKALAPTHYGRYVDDMIIIIPTEVHAGQVTPEFICELLIKRGVIRKKYATQDEDYVFSGFESISIQKRKINCFFFEQDAPNVLIDVAEKQIKCNSSEANLLPEFDLIKDRLNDTAYFFNSMGGSTKIRDIGVLQSNNYAVSRSVTMMKQLIKNTYIPEANRKKIVEFIEDLLEFYSGSSAFEFIGSWTSIFELILQLKILSCDKKRHDPFAQRFYRGIAEYIDHELTLDHLEDKEVYAKKKPTIYRRLKKCLREQLGISISIAMALDYRWNTTSQKSQKNIELAKKFRKSNMFNHNLVTFPLLNYLPFDQISICSFLEIQRDPWSNSDTLTLDQERLYWTPRFIHLDELLIYHFMQSLQNKRGRLDSRINIETIWNRYTDLNKITRFATDQIANRRCISVQDSKVDLVEVTVSNHHSPNFSAGLANTAVTEEDVIQSLLHPEHKMAFQDKEQLFRMANTAIKENASFIAFPEFFVPAVWLKDIARFAQKNNVAVIAGLRYIRNKDRAFNCTTIIQPCEHHGFHHAIPLFREKNFYAPEEQECLYKLGYRVENPPHPMYYIVHWDRIQYSTILCFEFTDINSRAGLKSKADALFVPQFNKDTNYFSSIVESASRDLHCFIVQANTSKYGDSRITGPYDTTHKNIVQIKGGTNDVVIIGKLEFEAVKKARQEYEKNRQNIQTYCFNCKKIKKGKYPNFFEACKDCEHHSKKAVIKDTPANFK